MANGQDGRDRPGGRENAMPQLTASAPRRQGGRVRRPGERLDPAVLKLALVLVLGAMAPLLDSTIVNVALRAIGRGLDAPVATVQWVSTGYLLAMAMAVPLSGWTAERFGAKRIWLTALALFLAGSMLCGAAWDIGSLMAFRVLQGVGGGLMLPVMQTLLMRAAAGRKLGRIMAVVTLPVLVGPIFGPVVGGLIVGHASWRWIFYVNVLTCVPAALLAWRVLPADTPRTAARLDVTGLLLLSPALAALIYGLAQVGTLGAFDRTAVIVPLACGAVLLAAFISRSLRMDRDGRDGRAEPLIDLRLFSSRTFAASSALLFLSGLGLFGPMLLLPLYYQQVLGAGIVAAGLLMAPQGLGSLLVRGAGALADRFGPRPIVLAGIALTAIGTIPFAFAGHDAAAVSGGAGSAGSAGLGWRAGTGTGAAGFLGGGFALAAGLVLRGAGLSAANLAVMVGAFRDLRREQIPHASSTTRIMQQLGGAFGAAVLAVVLQRQLASHPADAAGQTAAFGGAFTWALALTALAVVPALFLPRARARRAQRPDEPEVHTGTGKATDQRVRATGESDPTSEKTGDQRVPVTGESDRTSEATSVGGISPQRPAAAAIAVGHAPERSSLLPADRGGRSSA